FLLHHLARQPLEPGDELLPLPRLPLRDQRGEVCAARLAQPPQRVAAAAGELALRAVAVATRPFHDESALAQLIDRGLEPAGIDAATAREPGDVQPRVGTQPHEQPRGSRTQVQPGARDDRPDVAVLLLAVREQREEALELGELPVVLRPRELRLRLLA